jgi:plasmid stabilization system protein ParE
MKPILVKWDLIAKQDLKTIFDYLKNKSVTAAKNESSKIVYKRQVDEYIGEPY